MNSQLCLFALLVALTQLISHFNSASGFCPNNHLPLTELGIFTLAAEFSLKQYNTIAEATEVEGLSSNPSDVLVISCGPGDFQRDVDDNGIVTWFNTRTFLHFRIPNADVMCAPGVKAMFGQATGPAFGQPDGPTIYVLVLCPVILTQTDGRPKMFLDMNGGNLASNTRPDVDWLEATEDTINSFTWVGQHIDQLRDRVLSVIVGRMLLFVSVNQWSAMTGIESNIPSP